MTRQTVVVAGNGMVGFRFCRELVERAPGQYRVVVFGEEKRPAYDRVHLSGLLGDRRMDDLLLAPRSWYDRNGIELRLGDPLRSVDRRRGAVRSHSGREEQFDTLVLATGADPHVPSFPGNDLPGVFTYRNASDLIALKLRARKAGRAVILGGGAIGVEAAASLSSLGVEPHIIEAGPHLLARQLDPISAELVREQIERLGARVSCGQMVRAIRSDDGCLLIDLDGGAPLAADLVVVAAGVRPRDELARSAGLAIDARRGGVAVDDQLATSDPRILAIGDCARHAGTAYGLVGPGYEMARTLARRLAGESDACFTGGAPDFRLSIGGIEIAALGDHAGGGRPLVFQDGYQRRTLVLRGGSVVGVRAIGRWEGLPSVERAMESGRQLTSYEIERFCRTGDPWPPGRAPTVSLDLWSDTDLVCHCARVTCGAIRKEVERGCSTVVELGARTGAGTVCGTCRPVLAELCGDRGPAVQAAPRGRWSLGGLSVAALVACAGFLALGPPSLVGALSPIRWLSRFWYAGQDKIVSGFVLAGVAALALLFGLYRRVPRLIRSGRGPLLRAAHAGVGLAAVLLLVAHTGMHVGDNLNRALLVTFLGVIVTGGLVGVVTARARTAPALAPAGRRPAGTARGLLLAGHFLFFSVLPVLLAFHVIAVYYF